MAFVTLRSIVSRYAEPRTGIEASLGEFAARLVRVAHGAREERFHQVDALLTWHGQGGNTGECSSAQVEGVDPGAAGVAQAPLASRAPGVVAQRARARGPPRGRRRAGAVISRWGWVARDESGVRVQPGAVAPRAECIFCIYCEVNSTI